MFGGRIGSCDLAYVSSGAAKIAEHRECLTISKKKAGEAGTISRSRVDISMLLAGFFICLAVCMYVLFPDQRRIQRKLGLVLFNGLLA